MNNRIYLCSFASEDLNLSVERFIKQAKSFNYYKEIKVFRPKDLSQSIQERIKKFQNKGKNRYYGFEIWKEDIVRTYLNQIPKNSILQYTDVGCHLNRKGIETQKPNDMIELLSSFIDKKSKMLQGKDWFGSPLSKAYI